MQFFKKDSVVLGIGFTMCSSYEFSNKNATPWEFVQAFYEWDSKYLAEQHRISRTIIAKDSVANYIIWKLHGVPPQGEEINQYFLFGAKNCGVHNYNLVAEHW